MNVSRKDFVRAVFGVVSASLLVPLLLTARAQAGLTSGTFAQAIDHRGALPGQTFPQRFWIDSEYATAGEFAPVVFHVCGEGPGETFLRDGAANYAHALGAHLIYLEHRYYGNSQPFRDLSADHLRYLTLDNVIEDLAEFQRWIAARNNLRGKWVAIGGSYSGTVTARYRQVHPELIVGALAASAPMISGRGQAVGTPNDVNGFSSTSLSASQDRSWIFEACTSLGIWEATGPDARDSVQYPSPWLCTQLFPNAPRVDFRAYNDEFYAPYIANSASAPSNVLFTYGSADVWTQLGISPGNNANRGITVLIIPGAGHHEDLNAPSPRDSAAIRAARGQFVTLAKRWLQ